MHSSYEKNIIARDHEEFPRSNRTIEVITGDDDEELGTDGGIAGEEMMDEAP